MTPTTVAEPGHALRVPVRRNEPDRPHQNAQSISRRAHANPANPAALAALGLPPRAAPVPPSATLLEDRYQTVSTSRESVVAPRHPARRLILSPGARHAPAHPRSRPPHCLCARTSRPPTRPPPTRQPGRPNALPRHERAHQPDATKRAPTAAPRPLPQAPGPRMHDAAPAISGARIRPRAPAKAHERMYGPPRLRKAWLVWPLFVGVNVSGLLG